MTDSEYFKELLNELSDKTHPEVTHKKRGNHPGEDWRLKTICPKHNSVDIDEYGYGQAWADLEGQFPSLIKILPYAYDWNGDQILYFNSVWIQNGKDIILKIEDNSVHISLLAYNESQKNVLGMLKAKLEEIKKGSSLENKDANEIKELINFMEHKIDSKTRPKLKVIKNKDE